jgi:murein DD-endopeptidase MepM/ murein hydrolase activator NlpD
VGVARIAWHGRERMRWWLAIVLVVWGTAALADQLQLEGDFVQGGLVYGRVPADSEVRFAGRALQVTADGRFVLGFGRDAASPAELRVRYPDGREERHRVEVGRRDYQIQRIDGLPPRQVTPSEADLRQIRADAALLNAARRRDSELRGFLEPGAWPAHGPITGVFGSQRILNGQPRSPHRGVDVAAPRGTPVTAMAGGVVSVAATGMYFTGGTVMIDHGHGLHSIYAHLDEVRVEVGQVLAQGEVLGTIGATGRVTGPHLHWGVYWFDQALDPALLVPALPQG